MAYILTTTNEAADLASIVTAQRSQIDSLREKIDRLSVSLIEQGSRVERQQDRIDTMRAVIDLAMWYEYDSVVRCAWCDCFRGDWHEDDCGLANALKGGE